MQETDKEFGLKMSNVSSIASNINADEIQSDVLMARSIVSAFFAENKSLDVDLSKLEVFNEAEHTYALRQMARGMSITEIMDSFGVIWDLLPPLDQFFVARCFLQGRADSIQAATQRLFHNMEEDTKASLAYLGRFAKEWQGEMSTAESPQKLRIEIVEE